jgi:tetratricopeptide (TPR) repeat protein
VRICLFRLFSIVLCAALTALLTLQASAGQQQNEKQPGQLILDDAPLPLPSNHSADQSERDKVEALVLFSSARALELREKYEDALRLYQRAFRYDPKSVDIARAIVPLAIHLKQESVAVRYALKSVDLDEDLDPVLLRRLAIRLEDEGDWPKALKLFQKALARRADAESKSSEDVVLRMDTGRLLMLVGKYKEAADCFALVVDALDHPQKYELSPEIQKALMEEPGSIYAIFGDCFLQAGRIDEALAVFEKAQKRDPNEALWKFHQAQVKAKSGKPADALADLDEALAKHLSSEDMKPYELLADVLKDLGKKAELIARLEKLHGDDPQNAPLAYYLAEKYVDADMLDKAEQLYAAMVDKTPTLTGYINLLKIYRKTKQYNALLAVLGATAEKTDVLDALGTELLSISKDQDLMRGLVDALRKEIKADPDKPPYGKCFAMGLLELDGKQWDMAREFFQSAANAKPDQAAEVYLIWGIGLLVDNQSAEAVKVFQQGIDKKSLPDDDPRFYFYLARALVLEDRVDEALAAAKKAADIKSKSVRFRSGIAWIYYRAKRYDEAVDEYVKLLKDFDNNYNSDENRESLKEVRMALSNICVLQHKIPEAAEWLQQVLDEFPDDVGAMNDLGYLWVDENRHLARALKMIRNAVEAEPDNGAYRDSLGWALYRAGRYEESIAELLTASEKQQDGLIFDHLGDAYQKFHQPDKARNAWSRAAELLRKEKDEEKAKEVEEKMHKIDQEIKNAKIMTEAVSF